MKGRKLIIFAIIMSLCTSLTVSAVIVFVSQTENFLVALLERFLFAYPTVFFCIIFFAPRINSFVNKHFKG